MNTYYAQILNNKVINIIVLNDPLLIPLFSKDFDFLIDLSKIDPKPSIDWNYDGKEFSPPSSL